MEWIHSFPGAALTKHHELGDEKQPKSIFSQFWKFKTHGVGHAPSKASIPS
jgi:hypothetical protein